jgi:multidrug efflux pump subunit AcrA (membrane-fusion protein)
VAVPSFGTVEACADVEVRAQATGILEQVHFTEGQMVKKGDLLLSIDPRQPQANLKMAQASLERDQAQLKNAEREAARQKRTMSELVETALRGLFRSQRKRQDLPPLPTFHSGGTLIDVADRDALYQAMEGR